MHPALIAFLLILGVIIGFAVWRLYAIYRRRRRWQLLMTSHQSLHVARKRIVTGTRPLDED